MDGNGGQKVENQHFLLPLPHRAMDNTQPPVSPL
jgi:hypothetical protein